ncbi:MAG: MBL fold metallo-hydrolase, partial [Elusimicrobiales bacterium]|nr:MBL fold metallo-hydrolase [Elusimicrobiales bacterium]
MIEIIQIKVGKMDNFLYIIPARASFVVIDPSWGFEKIKEYSLKTSKKLSAVLLTHGHFDHFFAARTILQKIEAKIV